MLSDLISEHKFSTHITKFSTHDSGDDKFLLFFNSSWAEQLSIVDFSVVTPYIPDSPSNEKS